MLQGGHNGTSYAQRSGGLEVFLWVTQRWDLEGHFHISGVSHEKLETMSCQKGVGRKTDRHGNREKEDVKEGGERRKRREDMNENEYGAISGRQTAAWARYS